jgi:cell shape-determining protein MreC
MIIQSETIMSVVSSFEKIADKSDDVASKYLTNALKTATEENRTELLNSEKNEYEVLSERADALKEAVEEVRKKFQNDE